MLALLITPVFSLKIGPSSLESLARSGRTYDALQTLTDGGVGSGVITPVEVLVPAERRGGGSRGRPRRRRRPAGRRRHHPGDSAVVDVLPTDATLDSDGTAVVNDVRAAVEPLSSGDVGITGLGATVEDYFSAVYDKFPYVLALISLITYVLLVRTFRSVLLPLKAVLLNLISMAAVFGSIVFFWQHGPRVRRDLQRVPDRRHQLLAARRDLRVPLRPVHGLRGLHPGPDAGGVRPHRDTAWPSSPASAGPAGSSPPRR